ncbi:MAG TPA: hypothetical protein VLL52_05630 [Anaerolineae bacterium]|nr:hypothetical protein [Anaerolineae bacterium]
MFWRKKKKTPPQTNNGLLANPRPHHYFFAHDYLRWYCHRDPARLFAILSSDAQAKFIEFAWEQVCREQDRHEKSTLTAADINVYTFYLGPHPTILIQMPEAQAVAEAIMVAIVLLKPEGTEIDESTSIDYRYFTLELGFDVETNNQYTVFCEWRENQHSNMGEGPQANIQSFTQTVANVIFGDNSPTVLASTTLPS